jgi:hypothetical protein
MEISSPVNNLIRTFLGGFPSKMDFNAPFVAAAAAVPVVNPARSFLAIYISIQSKLNINAA